jgi:hypothetical protein
LTTPSEYTTQLTAARPRRSPTSEPPATPCWLAARHDEEHPDEDDRRHASVNRAGGAARPLRQRGDRRLHRVHADVLELAVPQGTPMTAAVWNFLVVDRRASTTARIAA